MFALPPAFEEKMKKILKEEYPAFREGYELPRKFGLRINRDKITPEEFEKLAPFELTPIPWVDNGFYYEEKMTVRPAIPSIIVDYIISRSPVP